MKLLSYILLNLGMLPVVMIRSEMVVRIDFVWKQCNVIAIGKNLLKVKQIIVSCVSDICNVKVP